MTQPVIKPRDMAACALALLVLLPTWTPRLSGPLDLRWDAAAYYILGTSLYQGEGYRFLNEPGQMDAIVWPPLLSAFVALHQTVLGTDDPVVVGTILRWSYFGIWCAYLGVTFFFLRLLLPRLWCVAGTVLVGLHMTTIWLSDRLYADLPLALLLVAFMYIALTRPRYEFITAALGAAAYFVRTAAIAVLFAWIADAALRRDWGAFARRVTLAAVPVLLWQGYIAHVEASAAYVSPPYAYARSDYALYNVSYTRNMMLHDPNRPQLGSAGVEDLPARSLRNLRSSLTHLGEAISLLERDFVVFVELAKKQRSLVRFFPWLGIQITLVAFGMFICAGAWLLARRARIVPLTIGFYLLLLSVLPTDYHWPRYLAAVAPLLSLCFLYAGTQLYGKASQLSLPFARGIARTVPIVAPLAALALQGATALWSFRTDLRPVNHTFGSSGSQYQAFTYDASFEAFDRGLDWLRSQPRAGAEVVVSSMPHWVYLRTGFTAVMPPFEADHAAAQRLIESVGPRYVVVDSSGLSPTQMYAAPVLASGTGWNLVWEDGSGLAAIYERSGIAFRMRTDQSR